MSRAQKIKSRAQKVLKTVKGEIRVTSFGPEINHGCGESGREAQVYLSGELIASLSVTYHSDDRPIEYSVQFLSGKEILEWSRFDLWESLEAWGNDQEPAQDPSPEPAPKVEVEIDFEEDEEETRSGVSMRPSLSQIEETVDRMLSPGSGPGKIRQHFGDEMDMGMKWEPLPLLASPVVKEQRDDNSVLLGFFIEAYESEGGFFCDFKGLSVPFTGDKQGNLIELLKRLYGYERSLYNEEIEEETPEWIAMRPSIGKIEETVDKVLSGKVKSFLNGFYDNELQWEPLHDLLASPIVTEERNEEDKLISYHASAYDYGRGFELDDLEVPFSGNKRADLIRLLSKVYLYEEFPQEEPKEKPQRGEVSSEIYDALDNIGAASIPENEYSLSEIKALSYRLNKLLEEPQEEPAPEPAPNLFHPEIRECLNRFSEARNSSDLYAAMKDLSFLLHEDHHGRLE